MNKKRIILFSLFLVLFIFPKDIHALTSSDYKNRKTCSGKYELARANTNDTITSINCYSSYSAAKTALNNSSYDDVFIFDEVSTTKIVDAKYALLDLSVNPETLTYFYESKDLSTRKYTYMDTGSLYGGVDGALLDVNYGKSVKVMIGGLSAWIADGTYEIVPLNWVKSSSSYTVNDSIRHNYVAKIQNTYSGSAGSTIGPKPDMLNKGTYYSYDGHYFYTSRLTMLKDYKAGNRNNAVNKNNPYYNYYMFLSNHSKTTYSALNIDEYIRNNLGASKGAYGDVTKDGSSKLYGQGTFFYHAQEKHGANAVLALSLSRNESANGRSNLAFNKNNGFGLDAVDSNPYQAAKWFPTFASSIFEFAANWITDGYADPSDSRYFGPVFGDKYIGMNVKYASDTYWSEKMAANYYSFDSAKGMQDYNYYQLGVVTGPTKAYMSANTSSTVVYTYPEKDDGVLIVGEVSNSQGNWYKLQSDKIIRGTTITTTGDYNWDSYVYVKKEQVTKINTAKDGYKYPSQVTEYKDSKYKYDLYINNSTFKPKVATITSDTNYYYDSTLTSKKSMKVIKDKLVMVYGVAYNSSDKPVAYLVTSDYMYDQKDWVPAGNIKFVNSDYGYQTVDISGAYEWVCSQAIDDAKYKIGGQYTYSYFPIVGEVTVSGVKWYKVPVSLSNNTNSYGYILASEANARITKSSFKVTNENVVVNSEPVITANNRSIVQGTVIDLLDGVSAKDSEDGDITKNIKVSGTVDNNKIGTYEITYSVTDSGNLTTTKKITITVTENKKPVITAEDKEVTIKTEFNPLDGVNANDSEDGDITKKIEVIDDNVDITRLGEYSITYRVVDSYNQEVTKSIQVKVVKDHDPEIVAKDKEIILNKEFNPLDEVSAKDSEDGDITQNIEVIENNVDITKLGTYKVKYKVIDSNDNSVTKEIKVTVIEKVLTKANGEFNLESLDWNKSGKYYTISGYLIIHNQNNNVDSDYEFVLRNKSNDNEYSISIDSWTTDVPYDLGATYDKKYKNSWFKGKLDLSNIPSGDYDLYMKAIKGDYYTEQIVDNMFNINFDRRAQDSNKGYSFKVLLSLRSKKIELSIRDQLITSSVSNTFRNMINDYEDISFSGNNIHLIGTSYNYGGTYNSSANITRKLVLENVDTYKQYKFDLGSTNKGSYTVTSTDKKSKEYVWYDKQLDVSELPKGTYSMFVYTKTVDAEDYGELYDSFGMLDTVSTTINGKNYSVSLNRTRQNRVELTVK
ncbi:MAG: DUF5011 domain-containing protein [Firmicutes bacterium]|nr:DUF5011 domain-containing protein [Bacillota bacterium]